MKRRRVTIWRAWGLTGPLVEQVRVAKEARRLGLTRNDGDKVREIAAHMRRMKHADR